MATNVFVIPAPDSNAPSNSSALGPSKSQQISNNGKSAYKYHDNVIVTVNSAQISGGSAVINITVENKANKEVSFATFKNMYLIGSSGEALDANPSQSANFFKVPAGSKKTGNVVFPGVSQKGTYIYQTKMFVMDPSYNDRDVRITLDL